MFNCPLFDKSHMAIKADTNSPFCVVTAYTESDPSWKRLGEITSKTKLEYCQKHGYGFRAYTSGFDSARPPSWSKLLFVKDALRTYEWVFWMDADAGITGDKSLEEIAVGGGEFVITVHGYPLDERGYCLNMGVFLAKRSRFVDWLFDRMWAMDHCINHVWWEQQAFIELWEDAKLDEVRLVGPRFFNSLISGRACPNNTAWVPGDFVLHTLALSVDDRIRLFEKHLAIRPETIVLPNMVGLISELTSKKHKCRGAIVGVDKLFLPIFLEKWTEELLLVDEWKHIPGYRDLANLSDKEQGKNYRKIRAMTAGQNVKVEKRNFREVAAGIEDGSLDWVFIDGPHSYRIVAETIDAWWPKIRDGGILCGHDYIDAPNHPAAEFEVKKAVDNFAKQNCLKVESSVLYNENFPSWAILKKTGTS